MYIFIYLYIRRQGRHSGRALVAAAARGGDNNSDNLSRADSSNSNVILVGLTVFVAAQNCRQGWRRRLLRRRAARSHAGSQESA